jgi:translation initiation factor IF-2
MTKTKNNIIQRPPVVAVMGHVDHGKSTLLDYIRQTNIVDKEAGGITQHISAYEVIHKDENGENKKITFLDTPGHEAFSKMRERGAKLADIAILVVSAEDGVKPQTIEAWKAINANNTPCIVAINKIDKPDANIERTKMNLAENEIYVESYGGKTPSVEISAKKGTGIDSLLSMILILAEIENFEGDLSQNASGYILETNLDPKRGVQATLVVKNGTLKKGMFIVSGDTVCGTKIIENFLGKMINEASFSSPIRVVGFNENPQAGEEFLSFENKKEAEKFIEETKELNEKVKKEDNTEDKNKKIIPIVIKSDVAGSLEAIEKEIAKIQSDSACFKIVKKGTGPISETDIKNISQEDDTLIIAFNVKTDRPANELALKKNISINNFDIIYKMTEWLAEEMEKRRPRVETVEISGKIKILKAFSRTKEKQVVGGKVTEGKISLGSNVKIMRRDFEIGRGKITNLEKGKQKTSEVEEGSEFGMMIESKIEIVGGDVLEAFSIVQK